MDKRRFHAVQCLPTEWQKFHLKTFLSLFSVELLKLITLAEIERLKYVFNLPY